MIKRVYHDRMPAASVPTRVPHFYFSFFSQRAYSLDVASMSGSVQGVVSMGRPHAGTWYDERILHHQSHGSNVCCCLFVVVHC